MRTEVDMAMGTDQKGDLRAPVSVEIILHVTRAELPPSSQERLPTVVWLRSKLPSITMLGNLTVVWL